MTLNPHIIRKTLAPASLIPLTFLLLSLSSLPAVAQTQQLLLRFTSGDCKIDFTLGDILHTVHGSFKLKRGEVSYDLATKSASGALVVDATSGRSNNRVRDRKMHREILESERYPEIIFRPDRVDGTLAPTGTSTLQVHGIFSLHGADHEFTMPVRLQVFPDHWTAESSFVIPYVKWGIKNPSTFFLRVSSEVEIEVHATGINPFIGVAAR